MPRHRFEVRCSARGRLRRHGAKVACAAAIRRPHAVRIRGLPRVIRDFGLGRDEDGKDRSVVTRRVKILQIQRVVPRLVVIGEAVLAFAALELDREDGRSGNQHGIDSAAESRNVELEEERAGQATESSSENVELLFPRLALVDVEVMGVRRSQGAEDMVRLGRQKAVDRR